MESLILRKKFLDFFEKRGHKIVPSSSLVPEDKTVLLTSAGMQQFIPYLVGDKDVMEDFGGRHLASVQKCFRTPDIDEVGDDTHHTFFEMLGNWSIGTDNNGEYFKEGAIKLALDFFIDEVGLDKNKFYITVFKGNKDIPKDEQAIKIWQENGIPKERIKEFDEKDNFWGPTATTGPCGPCSEIHYDRGEKYGCGKECGPNCENCNRFVELWNLVFMEYNKNEDGSFSKLSQSNVDTGIGFERLTAVLQGKDSAYETDLFLSIIKKIESLVGVKYKEEIKSLRVIADHTKGAVFLISDGVTPSNVEQGYILRRILRRAISYGKILNGPEGLLISLAKEVIEKYEDFYPELKENKDNILSVIKEEESKFEKTVKKGTEIAESLLEKGDIKGEDAFYLHSSLGFPLELIEEMASKKNRKIDKEGFQKSFKKHQEISRAGAEKKFGGVGKGATVEATKLHTTTHLLHKALREVLGDHVRQMGSDINSNRLRFDFAHHQKMTDEEIKKVEGIVNEKIQQDLEVKKQEMPFKEAIKEGALAFFKEKYPEIVSVYTIGDFSKEVCAGPHVKRTSDLGKFKIIKEQSSGSGVRRIKAVLE